MRRSRRIRKNRGPSNARPASRTRRPQGRSVELDQLDGRGRWLHESAPEENEIRPELWRK